ncbi:MAG: T9SS type A sorting domain-containing protein [Flavobacteriales bacterium]
MKKIITLFAFAPIALAAQTTFQVEVGGSLTTPSNLPYYAPQFITINVGDIVEWHNVSGEHQIYAGTDVFPDNPEGFTSGDPTSTHFTYTHTFTLAGVYDYHCDNSFQGQNHSTTQFGTITVLNPNGVRDVASSKAISLYPVPANDVLVLSLKGCTGVVSVDILSPTGSLVRTLPVQDNRSNDLDLSGLPAGQYYLRMDRLHRTAIKPFVKL